MRVLILISGYYVTQPVSDVTHAIKGENNVSPAECGIGSRPHKCFEWHKTINQLVAEHSMANIKNGRDAKAGEFPWDVLIVNTNVADIEVYTGINPFPLSKQRPYRAKNYFMHDDFLKNLPYDDVALIQLESPIVETKTAYHYEVNAVCLPEKGIYNHDAEKALMSGWGNLDEGVGNRERLQAAEIFIYPATNNVNDRNGTIMVSDQGDSDPIGCHGDSGSPVIQYHEGRAVVIGVYSILHNPKNATLQCEAGFQVYMRLSNYIDWIMYTVQTNHG